jgi:hypothetical protein
MKKFFAIVFVLFFAFIGRVEAITPENGWWWNPAASGTGYNIEIQDNVMALSVYTFDPSGAPLYYISAGVMSGDRNYNGVLTLVSGGQCIGCPYKPPSQVSVGTVSVQFSNTSTGSISINGGAAVPMQRLAYRFDMSSHTSLFGEWALVEGTKDFPVYFGERVTLSLTYTSGGVLYAAGNRSGSESRVALATSMADGSWIILLDSSTNYYTAYNFKYSGLNTIEGRSWTYLKTSNISGSGLPFVGFRSLSASLVKTGSGPGIATRKPGTPSDSPDIEAQNQQKIQAEASADIGDGELISDEILIANELLRESLRAMSTGLKNSGQ